MKQETGGLRMAIKYAFIMLVSGAFLFNCANISNTTPSTTQLYDANGMPIPSKQVIDPADVSKKASSKEIPDNFKIVLRTTLSHDEHRDHHDENHNRHHDGRDGYSDDSGEVQIDSVRLTIGRIEVLKAGEGWTVLYDAIVNGMSQEISLKPGDQKELFGSIVKAGEYLKVKIYLSGSQYALSSSVKESIFPLYLEGRHESDRRGHDDGDESAEENRKGERFKIKHVQPVQVTDGYLTTLYLEVDADEFVEYKDQHKEHHKDQQGAYFLDPEARFAGYELTLLAPDKTQEKVNDALAAANGK